jgi:hypothetical protein
MIVTIGFVALTGYIYLQPWGSGRLSQTSVFAPLSGVEIRQTSLIHEISDAPRMTRFMHNKIFMYGREIASQYFTYMSPLYLFIRGWGDKFVVPEQGMLFITSGIGLVFAIWYLRADLYKTRWFLLIIWTAIALVPAALTYAESPNMNRAALYPLLLMCLSAYGLSHIPWRVMCISVCVLFLWEVWYFGYMYQTHFDQANALRRQDAAAQISAKIDSYAQNGRKVWMPGTKTLAVYYLFTHRDLSPIYDTKILLMGSVSSWSREVSRHIIGKRTHTSISKIRIRLKQHRK